MATTTSSEPMPHHFWRRHFCQWCGTFENWVRASDSGTIHETTCMGHFCPNDPGRVVKPAKEFSRE